MEATTREINLKLTLDADYVESAANAAGVAIQALSAFRDAIRMEKSAADALRNTIQ